MHWMKGANKIQVGAFHMIKVDFIIFIYHQWAVNLPFSSQLPVDIHFITGLRLCPLLSVAPWLRKQIWSSRLWTTGTVSCVGEFALWSWHPRISETCGRREDSFWKCQFLFLYLSPQPQPPPPMLCHPFISFAHHLFCALIFSVVPSKSTWTISGFLTSVTVTLDRSLFTSALPYLFVSGHSNICHGHRESNIVLKTLKIQILYNCNS